jgi:hypothetical protein
VLPIGFENAIVLSDEFYKEVMAHPIPAPHGTVGVSGIHSTAAISRDAGTMAGPSSHSLAGVSGAHQRRRPKLVDCPRHRRGSEGARRYIRTRLRRAGRMCRTDILGSDAEQGIFKYRSTGGAAFTRPCSSPRISAYEPPTRNAGGDARRGARLYRTALAST